MWDVSSIHQGPRMSKPQDVADQTVSTPIACREGNLYLFDQLLPLLNLVVVDVQFIQHGHVDGRFLYVDWGLCWCWCSHILSPVNLTRLLGFPSCNGSRT